MKLIKYLFNKFMLPIYAAAALIFSMVPVLISGGGIPLLLRLFPIILCLLVAVRAGDDIFDYEQDSARKTQYLSRRELIALFASVSLLYVVLNVVLFGACGVISPAAVGYILLMEKQPLIKLLYMPLLFVYYFFLSGELGLLQLAVSAAFLAVSAAYYLFKRKVRK